MFSGVLRIILNYYTLKYIYYYTLILIIILLKEKKPQGLWNGRGTGLFRQRVAENLGTNVGDTGRSPTRSVP